MKIFTSVTAKLTQDLQDLLSQNTGGCLSDSVIIQELVSQTGLMLIQTGSLWELVGNVQSVVTAYAALSHLLKNKFSIYIEDLKVEDVISLGKADFNSSSDVTNDVESAGFVDASLLENDQRKTPQRRNKLKVPDPIVLSFNVNENTKGVLDVSNSEQERMCVKAIDSNSEREASTSKKESNDHCIEIETNDLSDIKPCDRSHINGRNALKRMHLKKARKRKAGRKNLLNSFENLRKSKRKRVKKHLSSLCYGDTGAQVSQEALIDNESNKETLEKQGVEEICDSKIAEIKMKSTQLDSIHTDQMGINKMKIVDSGLEIKEYDSLEDLEVAKNDNILYKKVEEQWLRKSDNKAINVPCPAEFCTYVGKLKQNTTEHYARMHSMKNLKCKFCDAFFSLYRDLKRHLKHHDFNITCEKCGKMYKSERSFKEHEKTHEDDFVKPKHECDTCGKRFSTKYVLRYHIKSEHMGMKKTFICPTCGKSFTQKQSYITHANVHMGLRPYVCEVCGVSFPYEKSLREHKFMHDEGKNFKCEVCGKHFKQPSALGTHMKIHKETKDHLCKICGKGFTQRQALLRHERVHSGDKPYTCNICSKNFNDASIIRRHMIMVHKTNPKDWRSFTLNDTPKASEHFVQILNGEIQPQLKVRNKHPIHAVSMQESQDSNSQSQTPLVSVTRSNSEITLTSSSLASHGAFSERNISVDSSAGAHLKTNTVLSQGPPVALAQTDCCFQTTPSNLRNSSGDASLYHNYQSSLPPSSLSHLQARSEATGSGEHLNATLHNSQSENLLFQYMHLANNYSNYNANQ